MQLYTGPLNTLNDCARAGKNLMVECKRDRGGCGHMRGFAPFKLRHVGKDTLLDDIERRLTCIRCHRRVAKILIHMTRAEWIVRSGYQPRSLYDWPRRLSRQSAGG